MTCGPADREVPDDSVVVECQYVDVHAVDDLTISLEKDAGWMQYFGSVDPRVIQI